MKEKCPLCKSINVANVSLLGSNNIVGPGSRSKEEVEILEDGTAIYNGRYYTRARSAFNRLGKDQCGILFIPINKNNNG